MSRADRILAIAVVVLAIAIVPAVRVASALAPAASMVTIDGPSGTTHVPLGVDTTLTVAGARGAVVVSVRGGSVSVVDAECPDHVCIHSGPVSRAGQAIACVPNGVTVRIGGDRSDGLDTVAR